MQRIYMVVWWYGSMVVWSHGRTVVWWYGRVVVWSNGRMVGWSDGREVVWSDGRMVVWWYGRMVAAGRRDVRTMTQGEAWSYLRRRSAWRIGRGVHDGDRRLTHIERRDDLWRR